LEKLPASAFPEEFVHFFALKLRGRQKGEGMDGWMDLERPKLH
jgi:hypothetical protein